MNERIKERIKQLADKAGQLQLATPDNPSADAIMVLIGPNIEKFAELILKECLDQLFVRDPNVDYDKGIAWSKAQIKQHFGVRE